MTQQPIDTIHVKVTYCGGAGDGYYVAHCEEITAAANAPSFDEVTTSIRQLIAHYVTEQAPHRIVADPCIVINI